MSGSGSSERIKREGRKIDVGEREENGGTAERLSARVELRKGGEWGQALPWFQSVCSTITIDSLDFKIYEFPDDPTMRGEMEDTILHMSTSRTALRLTVETPLQSRTFKEYLPRLYSNRINLKDTTLSDAYVAEKLVSIVESSCESY